MQVPYMKSWSNMMAICLVQYEARVECVQVSMRLFHQETYDQFHHQQVGRSTDAVWKTPLLIPTTVKPLSIRHLYRSLPAHIQTHPSFCLSLDQIQVQTVRIHSQKLIPLNLVLRKIQQTWLRCLTTKTCPPSTWPHISYQNIFLPILPNRICFYLHDNTVINLQNDSNKCRLDEQKASRSRPIGSFNE